MLDLFIVNGVIGSSVKFLSFSIRKYKYQVRIIYNFERHSGARVGPGPPARPGIPCYSDENVP